MHSLCSLSFQGVRAALTWRPLPRLTPLWRGPGSLASSRPAVLLFVNMGAIHTCRQSGTLTVQYLCTRLTSTSTYEFYRANHSWTDIWAGLVNAARLFTNRRYGALRGPNFWPGLAGLPYVREFAFFGGGHFRVRVSLLSTYVLPNMSKNEVTM